MDGLCKSRRGEACGEGGIYGIQRRALAAKLAKPPKKPLSKMARKSPVVSDRFGSIN